MCVDDYPTNVAGHIAQTLHKGKDITNLDSLNYAKVK
jgi:hypothetical protein